VLTELCAVFSTVIHIKAFVLGRHFLIIIQVICSHFIFTIYVTVNVALTFFYVTATFNSERRKFWMSGKGRGDGTMVQGLWLTKGFENKVACLHVLSKQ